MPDINKIVIVHHPAEQMYNLVTNVADYPKFLPWCGGVEVRQQDETSMEASIIIDFKGLKHSFATHNKQVRPSLIKMYFVDGPFKRFYGEWKFIELGNDACKIEFLLHYEFSNFLLEKLIGPVFFYITNTLVDSFVKRADRIYVGQ
ncbi:type II toxin-antitoxin system RatA family toxin [Candidatus Pandoraea novymonadis]|uniref:Persistence and stress-resistance toxin PasT n=1 Tax=Candidatus Pandoraea novymonadis TaxID=1808959 RepID=A0ABX5FE70_9BURK|nr:type II toxin-antitoxin system RatA family toxin [Candidatus Pandoraea novymonadis]PSB92015.1 Persistence and stress-resistance toxin PasT [Candidatus Pandoraea novymonadis]